MPDIKCGMVLAAGLGTRMRPLTLTTPKPLIPVAGRTMADRAVDLLVAAGVERVVINISYLGEQIRDHFATRTDVEILLSEEDEPLETGGGVQKALPLLGDDPFFVVNGDAVLLDGPTPTLTRLAARWNAADMDVLLLLHTTAKAHGYAGQGDFMLGEKDALEVRPERSSAPFLFTGTQILSPKAFAGLPEGAWSLRKIYDQSMADGRGVGMIHDGEWFHVGDLKGLEEAEDYFKPDERMI